MEKHGWLLWAVLPLSILAAVWFLTRSPAESLPAGMNAAGDERSRPVPTRTELASLQASADAACRCGRTRGRPNDDRCWADYRRSVARFEPESVATACAEESTSIDCFGPGAPFGENQVCVSTGRMYGACSDAEERTRLAGARRRQSGGCGH